MTLFAIPFTCSLAVRLTLAERDIAHTVRWMRRHEHRLDDGASFDALNPKRRVPALLVEDELLTEIVAILHGLDIPRSESEGRRHLEWLCYLATELHRPPLFAMFDPASPPELVQDAEARLLPPVLAHLSQALETRPTLLGGDTPSPADHYLFWGLTLARWRRIPSARTAALDGWYDRMLARPAVARVIGEERAMLASLGAA